METNQNDKKKKQLVFSWSQERWEGYTADGNNETCVSDRIPSYIVLMVSVTLYICHNS